MIDLHSHLLPGLDDGAANWTQSLDMARLAVADGIAGMVCTPHWVYALYDNTRERIVRHCGTLRQKLLEADIPLQVYAGCEIRLDPDIPAHLASGRLITYNDRGRYALIELPGELIPGYADDIFRNLLEQGITPVLSHPERYPALIHNPARLYDWIKMGLYSQMTAASLLGRFGSVIRRFSLLLLEHGLAHILATDAHSPTIRAPRLGEAVVELQKIVGSEIAEKMVVTTPRAILSGEAIHVPAPVPFSDKSRAESAMRRSFFFSA
jgi:protein-tyrosine phosphatase